jgi:hypothetical protein
MSTSSHTDPHAGSNGGTNGNGNGRHRRSRRGGPAALTVDAFLDLLRVSELQEMWEFWQGGQKVPAKKGDLLGGLRRALGDEAMVGQRIKLLSDRPREVLVRLVRTEGFRAALNDLLNAGGNPLEAYEVEAAGRALARRGFVRVEHESKKDVFSLAGFLASLAPLARGDLLDRLAVPPGAETSLETTTQAVLDALGADPLAHVPDDGLRAALRRAAVEWGGVVPRAEFDTLLGTAANGHGVPPQACGKRLRPHLEGLALGTVTSLDLAEYGLDLGGETRSPSRSTARSPRGSTSSPISSSSSTSSPSRRSASRRAGASTARRSTGSSRPS